LGERESPRAEGPTYKVATGENSTVRLRDLWGTTKLAQLESESSREAEPVYVDLAQAPALGNPFAHRIHTAAYTSWPRLSEMFLAPFPGIKTSRDALLVDIDRETLEARMELYLGPKVSDAEMAGLVPSAMEPSSRFTPIEIRRKLQNRGYRPWQIMRYAYRPFDSRWLYWEPNTKLLDEKRENYIDQFVPGTPTLIAQQKSRAAASPPQVASDPACIDIMDRSASCFPMSFLERGGGLLRDNELRSNLIGSVHLHELQLGAPEGSTFFHALAVMHTPQYRTENSGALLGDWPRIPLPATAELLTHSATLGRRLSELLDPESSINLAAEWSFLSALKRGQYTPAEEALKITASWGSRGQGSTVMPGRGKLTQREWTPEEREKLAILEAANSLTLHQSIALLGETCVDVYLNGETFWSAIPINVWNYTLGGYQVLKKWLSYREFTLLGRPLHEDESKYFAQVVRRIAAILLLGPALDASYQAILPTATGLPAQG
jgi:hypothetical protein